MYKIKLHKKELSPLGYNMIVKGLLMLFISIGVSHSASAQGIIILEQQVPSTQVMVTATEQVILKPGFHAVGTAGSFDAKIGSANSMYPIIPMAAGSTAVIQTIPIVPAAPSSDQNYIVTTIANKAVTDPAMLDDANSNTTIQYFDGLGRPVEIVQKSITPSGKDLIDITEYDGAGRTYRQWLPAAATASTGAFVVSTTFKTSLASTQYAGDANPYAETILENSPLSRTLGQRQPGAVWNVHPTGVSYQTNGSEVLYFYVNSSNQLQRGDNYTLNTLYKTVATDEDGKTVTEYRDKLGQVVMKRSSSGVDTYYAYNHLGELSYVLPPNFVDKMGSTTSFSDDDALLKQFAYLYQYDERGNCIYKRLPGCTPIYMVYDKANRLVLSQDGNQRKRLQGQLAQWSATKYDSFGRAVFIGLMYRSEVDSAQNYKSIRDVLSNDVVTESYTAFASATALTINYYDNYNFISDSSPLAYQVFSGYDKAYPITATAASGLNAKGLLTGTRTYFLNGSGSNTIAMYYDDRGRVVQTRASNHLLGYDITYNRYNFTGKVLNTRKDHNISGQAVIPEVYRYAYDKAERLLLTRYKLGANDTITLASNTYDELGRLSTKNLGGIDATTYTYNIRNWTTGITGSRFTENLYYNANTVNLPNFTPVYNGNIAGMQWSVPSESLGYNRAYTFVYDALNRLTDANYCGVNGSVVAGTTGKYDEHFTFDRMGNFNSLLRIENGSMINNLSFAYTGNQLKKVDQIYGAPYIPYGSEAFNDKQKIDTEYSYDQNGSTTSDVNTGISTIQYNLLNLPDIIQFTAGHKNLYTYDASGRKLEAINYTVADIINVPIGTISSLPDPSRYTKLTTDYVGNMIYENGALKEILLPDGYYQGGVYYYYLKDHLGDNRVVINSSGTVIEKSHYYPSGMRFYPESTSNSAALPYRYNGKEMEAMNGLNQYDYGARRRGAGLPIWTAVDPLCEMKPWQSPYMYCSGNPVNRTDPTGLYDLPEVTVTAPAHKNNNNYNSPTVQLISDEVRRNEPYIPRIMTPTPKFNLSTNPNVNNVVSTNNKDSKKDDGTLRNISDALTAAGVASGSFEVAVRNEAGKEIVYVTMKGTEAAVQSAKVLSVLKEIGGATFVLGIAIDITRTIAGDPNQPWYKTVINGGVSYLTVVVIGGGPGLAIGAAYYVIDNTVGWKRVITPASNDQWVPNRAVFSDGSSTSVCFKAGTKILSKAGLKPIEQICIGDSVYSYNQDKNAIELNKVLKSFERKTQGIYELTTDNQKIFVTAEHPFYVEGKGWVKVKNIEVGKVLKTKNASIERVTNIKGENYDGNVYNIEVEGNHNYFVTSSNILVHNK